MNAKRKPPTNLSMQKRIQILDWLRAHPDGLPNMSGQQIVDTVTEAIQHPCNLNQIRQIAKAARMHWKIKKTMPSGKTGTGGRMDRLEARIANIEQQLGISLPTDDEI